MKIYLDNNRATMVDPQVTEAMTPFGTEHYAHPAAPHDHAKALQQPYADAIEKIAMGIHAYKEDTIHITSGADDSNDRLFKSIYIDKILTGQGSSIIISERESSAIQKAAAFLETKGCRVTVLPVNSDGIVEAASLRSVITEKTALVSITMVDGESGAIMPIDEMVTICADYHVPLHSDITHAIGKVPIDSQMLSANYLTFSAETFHGPQGVGALYVKKGSELESLMTHSTNTPGIIGMGKAMELASDAQAFEMEDVRELRDELEEALRAIPDSQIIVPWAHRVPNTLLIAFKGVESEALLWRLNRAGISAYREEKPNIIDAIGADTDQRHCVIGFALSRFTTEEEIAEAITIITKTVEESR